MPINIVKQSLLGLPRLIKRGLVVFCDVLICGLSVWLAFGLRLDWWGYFQNSQWMVFATSIGLSFPLFVSFGLYRAIFRYIGLIAFSSIVRAFIVYSGIFFCIFTIFGVGSVPRSIGVIQPILLFIGIGACRYLARSWLGGIKVNQKGSHIPQSVVLIYGAGSAGRQLAASLSSNNEIICKGFIDDGAHLQGSTINGIAVYSSANLRGLIQQLEVSDVLLAIPSVSSHRRSEIITSLNDCRVRVRTLPRFTDIASGKVKVSDLHDLDMNDLLGRTAVPPKVELLEKNIRDQAVLVTGAGGSIGSELCRQIIKFSPKSLILIDNSEHSLYLIYEELKGVIAGLDNDCLAMVDDNQVSSIDRAPSIELVPYLASVRDKDSLKKIFRDKLPNTVFHAAAYKHVPLVEQNSAEGIRNNVFGTLVSAQVSLDFDVSNFILVSTDKAVRPTNVMGASKRIAELVLQAMADLAAQRNQSTIFSMVRFGNVLGLSGSVAPLFSSQIAQGGPITLTHPEVTRYFMTIPEAAQLVVQAGAMAVGGDVFVLDMGGPVRIYDLATKMVYLSGLLVKDEKTSYGDIEIKVTGLRPGEKLYEELLIGDNPQPTTHPKIMKAHEEFLPWDHLQQELEKLILALDTGDARLIKDALKKLVPGYYPAQVG
ncbi:nucleoside-diphosphate sugar epimerase/dehydratase [Polynucleobacter sp. AP-Titi-500A-B4]|uniref:polysaccharide biosynthesis protein n=1 Tax=Polynucleobacter sp. AP-Titi-500A-B4 TaxID=2576923 RepID=UPI00203BA29A|nr:nucleoside-diphosphate sugar epimerase/dehydratase [Polynucleobacter sp. AP-Titi-500A-B4]QWE12834.1 polysaccharide biosynthesis protein [Polynucleobacter sp. AP-Titi-500A-B4]